MQLTSELEKERGPNDFDFAHSPIKSSRQPSRSSVLRQLLVMLINLREGQQKERKQLNNPWYRRIINVK
jgi:hypothetical protein